MSSNNNNNKVKGLLKGLRFISQIFDNEKEAEIQIGNPTDVKHVAHIGWDGPAECAPSWMNEFKSVPGITTAPPNPDGNFHSKGHGNSIQHSQESMRECQAKEKSDKPRHHHKKSSKHSFSNDLCNEDMHIHGDSLERQRSDLPPKNQSNHSKKSHHHHHHHQHHNHHHHLKMSKEASNIGNNSSKSRSKAHNHKDPNFNKLSPSKSSISKSRTTHMSFEDEEELQKESCEDLLRN